MVYVNCKRSGLGVKKEDSKKTGENKTFSAVFGVFLCELYNFMGKFREI